MVRFVHTSDWQLGMTRHFLSPEAQSRFTDARIQAIRSIGAISRERHAAFVVVAGDVFESNLVDRQLVLRALEALREASLPFYLLPGNHDPLDASSVYRSRIFLEHRPSNVTVLEGEPVEPVPGVTLASAPWRSKRMVEDPVAAACARLQSSSGITVLVAHGAAETVAPDLDNPALIRMAPVEAAFDEGRLHYLALGDRHSRTTLGESGRAWYSGAPEPTDYDEEDPGHVLCVDLEPGHVRVEPVRCATWRFKRERASINALADVARLRTFLDGLLEKDRTILKLAFEGTVSLETLAELEETVEHFRTMFAAIERRETDSDLVVLPAESDFSALGLAGFAALAASDLADKASRPGDDGLEARGALALLHRLARGAV